MKFPEHSLSNRWSFRGMLEAAIINILALAVFWIPTLVLLSFVHSIGYFTSGPLDTASVLLSTLGGIVLAHRVRARLTLWILSLCAAGITINLIVDMVKQSGAPGFVGSNAFAWLIAAALGAAAGASLTRWKPGVPGVVVASQNARSPEWP